ncbi:sugar kinase [Nocardia sp. NPDC004722]
MTEVFLMGEALAVVATDQGLRHADQARLDIAGAEFNVAVGLARLGHSAAWLGVLSADALGTRIAATLRGEGVDIADCAVDDSAATGVILKETLIGRVTRTSYYRTDSAGSRLSPLHLPRGRIAGAKILHLTGITPALSSSAMDAAWIAVRDAQAGGTTISFDLNYRVGLWPSAREAARVLTEFTACADIVFASTDELDHVASVLPTIPELVITRGGEGASAQIAGRTYNVSAHDVQAVDTVGAGDAFVAGYLSGVLDGLDPQDRLHRGSILGAFAVGCHSDWRGLPDRAQLSLFDHENGASLR